MSKLLSHHRNEKDRLQDIEETLGQWESYKLSKGKSLTKEELKLLNKRAKDLGVKL